MAKPPTMNRLAVAILGNRKAGKSYTWNALFGETVRTGKYQRRLGVAKAQLVDVFLVSGSPEERKLDVGDIIADKDARIILCSVQYTREAHETFDYFVDNGFDLVVQWLNPGYSDPGSGPDHLGLVARLQYQHALLAIRDGQVDASLRVEALRQIIHGWASARRLVYSE